MAATAFARRDLPPPPLTIPGQKFLILGCLAEGNQAKGWTMPEMITHLCFSEGFWGGKKGSHSLSTVLPHGTWNLEVKWIFSQMGDPQVCIWSKRAQNELCPSASL